jgi:hypothetical protein
VRLCGEGLEGGGSRCRSVPRGALGRHMTGIMVWSRVLVFLAGSTLVKSRFSGFFSLALFALWHLFTFGAYHLCMQEIYWVWCIGEKKKSQR